MKDAVTRLRQVQVQCTRLCEKAGRTDPVTVIAVTKTQSPAAIEALLDAGHRHFGENRVQEAGKKWPAFKEKFPDICLHLLGPLQTNKVSEAAQLFDAVHTVDRLKVARVFARTLPVNTNMPFFLQINTGYEPQKAGVYPDMAAALLRQLQTLDGSVKITGVMGIPPVHADPVPHFHHLAAFAREHRLKNISMGMSSDWQNAVLSGSTHIRLGTALFGERS